MTKAPGFIINKKVKTFLLKARSLDKLNQKRDLKIQPPDKIYFMGICGTAMASLARELRQKGFDVSGSDEKIYPPMSDVLKRAGISVFKYNKKNIEKSLRLIITGNVISSSHEEIEEAQKLKIPVLSFPEFLEQTLLSQTKNLVMTGTHGKSSSSSLMAHVAETLGHNPGFFIGALPGNFKNSFRTTDSPWFVIEGDEYDSSFFAKKPKFFYYNPFAVLLTGIEFDHGDIYKNKEEIKSLFCDFVSKIPKEGRLVLCIQNEDLGDVRKFSKAPVLTYGSESGDWFLKNRQFQNDQQTFDIQNKKGESYSCTLPLMGEHNARNALGVFVLSQELGWPAGEVLKAFQTFKGIRRRLEFKGQFQGLDIYEDFAHHPTAVRAGLSALREKYPHQRLIALFEPRSFTSRLNVFQKDYISSFEKADLIFISPPYDTSKIPKEKRFSSLQLVEDLKKSGKKAFYYEDFSSLKQAFIGEKKEGDVAVFMSSGAFGNLLQEVKSHFS